MSTAPEVVPKESVQVAAEPQRSDEDANRPGERDSVTWLEKIRKGRVRRLPSGYFDNALITEHGEASIWPSPQPFSLAAAESLRPAAQDAQPVPSGFASLDRALQGGLTPGRIYALGGLAGMGKTALACALAYRVARAGNSVHIFSRQLAAPALARRVLTGVIGARADPLNPRGTASSQELHEAVANLGNLAITIDDAPLYTWLEASDRITRSTALVIIDGLEFLLGRVQHESRDAELWELMAGLRIVAGGNSAALLVTMRLPSAGGRALTRHDIPGALLSNSDAALLLDRPSYHDPESPHDEAWVEVVHNRWGVAGRVPLQFRLPAWFDDVAGDPW